MKSASDQTMHSQRSQTAAQHWSMSIVMRSSPGLPGMSWHAELASEGTTIAVLPSVESATAGRPLQ
jgi:hypothetical protein